VMVMGMGNGKGLYCVGSVQRGLQCVGSGRFRGGWGEGEKR
jgi:hypothetical protein